ncbi:MAG TPA: DUF885 family protein [Pyrinomonadaceae bacterium]|jgi:uncharacterized protein (DUF885 family)|nr:DUF885 family protein [Pyrinomonadaceae bacterium]
MKRKLRVLSFVLAACALFFSTLPSFETFAQNRRGARRAGQGRPRVSVESVNARFNQIADAYLRGYYAFNPTEATALGLHEYDGELESRSREKVSQEVRRLRAQLQSLLRIWDGALSEDARLDYQVLVSHAQGQLLELEDVRMWQRDPNIYNRIAAASIDNILKRNYAPAEQRLDAFLAREREIPRLLAEARANLESPPRIYTEIAIAQTRGSVGFFTRVVPQMIERAGGGRLSAARRAQLQTSNETVIAALDAYADWQERELLPRSTTNFAIGAENFRRKLLYEEMVSTPLTQLLQTGERELRRTQEEMRSLAEEITPGRGVAYALHALAGEHPSADGLVGDARAELGRIRAFVRTQNILTPPPAENLIVTETPEYARSLSFASMDTPGPFERTATEAYYYLTPPDANWNERQREEHLGHYNRYSLPLVSIHEVYPGHYYQLLKLKGQSSRVRKTFGAASFVEGWAHYSEQMMLDEGFGGNNPRFRLAQLHAALQRLCRFVVGIRLHTQGMSYEEAVDYFMREGYLERVNAEREARRGTIDPTYLVYTLGKMEILNLREEWRARLGPSFNLGEFHDRLLSYGMPPIRLIRQAMLGNTARSSSGGSAGNADEATTLDFSVLATGAFSHYAGTRSFQLVMNRTEWANVWRMIGGDRAPAPDISFDTRAVVVVFQGQKPTGGYSISIAEIRRSGRELMVRVNEHAPARTDITTQALTSPFVAVSIPRPPEGATVKFADNVDNVPQNLPRQRPDRRRRGYRRRG